VTPAPAQQPPASANREKRRPAPRRAPQHDPDDGYVAIGRVLAPFGLKGELKVQSLTDNPRRFAPKSKLWAGEQPVSIASVREAGGQIYVKFKGFTDRTAVGCFRHTILQVPESALPALPEGEYYRFQLIGLMVADRSGKVLGTLDEIIETGANDVYRVHPLSGPDLLLPAIADVIVSVDLASRRMVVDPPAWG